MGNKFSRAKLLRAFRHLPSVPSKHVHSSYETYKKHMNSPAFLTRNQFLEIFYPDLLEDTDSRKKKDKKKEQETIRADLQYQILDRRNQGRVSALDIFVGLALLVHDSMENRLRFVFKCVDFTRNGALNMAELILLFGSALRGIARMKGIEDCEYWHCERLAREVFRKSGVHFRAGEGVGDYAEGGVTVKHLITWARDDSSARSLLDNVDFGAYLSSLLTKQQTLWGDLIDVRAAMMLQRKSKLREEKAQSNIREKVRMLRTTDPSKFNVPKILADSVKAVKKKSQQQLVKEKMDRREQRKKDKAAGISSSASKMKMDKRIPLWDIGPHSVMEQQQALALAREIYGVYGVLSPPDNRARKKQEIEDRRRLRSANMSNSSEDDDDDGDGDGDGNRRGRKADQGIRGGQSSSNGMDLMPFHCEHSSRPFLGDELELYERRWWITVDDLKYALLGMCRMPHLSLKTMQQAVHQLAGPMSDAHVINIVPRAEDDDEDEEKKNRPMPPPSRRVNNDDDEGDEPDEEEKIYFPRFVKWLCGDGDDDDDDNDETNANGTAIGMVASTSNKKNAHQSSKSGKARLQQEEVGHKEVMQKGRLREIKFMATQRKQLIANASRTRNMQREQMVFHRTQVREARLLELTLDREADEEDRQARLDMELSMLEEANRKASEGSMQASMSEGDTPEERMQSAQTKAKRRWMNLRLRDAAESGYLEQTTVRALAAMLDGEDLLGAIAAAKLEPKPVREREDGEEVNAGSDSNNGFPGQGFGGSQASSSRPSSRGTSSGWGSSRPSSRGDGGSRPGSRPGSRQRNRSRPGSRSGSRPTTGTRRGGSNSGSASSSIDALYGHRTEESKVRHMKLVRYVEANTGPEDDHGNGPKRDDMIIVPHVNYECPIPWNHMVNGLTMWLKRISTNYMRNVLHRAKEYRWHVFETGRHALRLEMFEEEHAHDGSTEATDSLSKKKIRSLDTDHIIEREVAESYLTPMEQALIQANRPQGFPEQGKSSLAGEDRIGKERVWSFKVEVAAPGSTLKVPHFDPVDSDDENNELDEFGNLSPTKSMADGNGGSYTARTEDSIATFATGMTGMTGITQFTQDTEMTSMSVGEDGQHAADEDDEDNSDESEEESEEEDESELKLPEKPAIICDIQVSSKHPHSQQILDRQTQLMRSNDTPHPPSWLDAMKRQFEKAGERTAFWIKKLQKQREDRIEARRIKKERERAKNRSKGGSSPIRQRPVTVAVSSNNPEEDEGVGSGQGSGEGGGEGGGEVDEEEEDEDENAEFAEDGMYMDTETDNLGCLCFEFSCKEGVLDPAAIKTEGAATPGTAATGNAATGGGSAAQQMAAAGMAAGRGAAQAAAGFTGGRPAIGESAASVLERLKNLAECLQNLLLNPHVEEMYEDFLFHPDVRITRSMGVLCIRVAFSVRPEADLFHVLPKMYGMTRKQFFSSSIGSGVGSGGGGGGRSKSGKYTGGGLTLFETRIESNMDIYDGLRMTVPYVDHHHNMVRWDVPKVKEKKVKNFVGAKLFAMKLKSKAKKLVEISEEKKVQAAKDEMKGMNSDGGMNMFGAAKKAQQEEEKVEQSESQSRVPSHLKFQPSLTFMGEKIVETIFTMFDCDEDGALSFGEINCLNVAVGNPLLATPTEYAAIILEDGFHYQKVRNNMPRVKLPEDLTSALSAATGTANRGRRGRDPNSGIGLTLKGLKQAYTQGEGDLGRDMSILGFGSLSNYLELKIIGKIRATPSLFRILQRPMSTAPHPSWYLGKGTKMWRQQTFGYIGRLLRKMTKEYYYKRGLTNLLSDLFGIDRGIRKVDGSAQTMNISEWIAWLVGQPGALAHQILSIRQNLETLVDRWRRDLSRTRPPTGNAAAGRGQQKSHARHHDAHNDHDEIDQEALDGLERDASLKDEEDAKSLIVKILNMAEGTVEELISVVAVSGNLSLRATMSGFDIHRIFFDDMEEEKARRAAAKAEAMEELMEKKRQRQKGF